MLSMASLTVSVISPHSDFATDTLETIAPTATLDATSWYLVRTKCGKEQWVGEQLSAALPEVFLPMLKARASRPGRLAWSLTPLFPGYLFARCELSRHYFDISYTSGVYEIVSAGDQALAVPDGIVEGLRRRVCNGDGAVEIAPPEFAQGDRLKLIEGPLKGFSAVFDRYLSGRDRVAILLGTVGSAGCRVVLPEYAIARDG
jgi:transcriptional antiterminator RfaH